MSYCVNCGVELDKTQHACPLCNTPVINPSCPIDTVSPTPYPLSMSLPKSSRRKYLVFVITGVLLITSMVCLILNFLAPDSGIWSLFILFSCALFWLLFILPLMPKNTSPYLLILVDAISISLYIYSYTITLNSKGWFTEIVLPALGLSTIISVIMTAWLRKNRREWPYICIFIAVSIALLSLLVDFLLHVTVHKAPGLSFSIVSVVCGAALVVFITYVAKNKRFRAWLTRKIHI